MQGVGVRECFSSKGDGFINMLLQPQAASIDLNNL